MKSLDAYLDRPTAEERADEGARKLLALLQRKAAKGQVDGDR